MVASRSGFPGTWSGGMGHAVSFSTLAEGDAPIRAGMSVPSEFGVWGDGEEGKWLVQRRKLRQSPPGANAISTKTKYKVGTTLISKPLAENPNWGYRVVSGIPTSSLPFSLSIFLGGVKNKSATNYISKKKESLSIQMFFL